MLSIALKIREVLLLQLIKQLYQSLRIPVVEVEKGQDNKTMKKEKRW